MTTEVLSTVVNETQFGQVSEIRFALAVILAGCLVYDRIALARGLGLAISLGLIAAIAWTGHAGSTAGEMGILHLAADALHLFAAAVWIGGLVSLVLLLTASRRDQSAAGASFARHATERFSTMGIAAVAAILVTGIVNTWILVGSWRALIATEYGQLLMLKVALFAVMLLFAAVKSILADAKTCLAAGRHAAARCAAPIDAQQRDRVRPGAHDFRHCRDSGYAASRHPRLCVRRADAITVSLETIRTTKMQIT